MGAITLNTLVCGLLYHPVEQHMKIVPLDEGIDNEALTLDESVDRKQESAEKTRVDRKYGLSSQTVCNNDDDDKPVHRFSDLLHNVVLESADEKVSYETEKKLNRQRNEQSIGAILSLQSDIVNSISQTQEMQGMISRENIITNTNEIGMTIRPKKNNDANGDLTLNSQQGSFSEDSKPQFESLKNMNDAETKEEIRCKHTEELKQDTKSKESDNKPEKTRFFDLSVLKDPIYLVILISNSTSAISNTNFMILLPSYAIAEGFDKNSSALLLSIVSALDLVGRISGASLSDIDFVPKYYYFVGGLGTSGIALALLPMATSYTMLSFFCGLFGLSSGMYIGITTVILADMLGTEKLSSSYGISLFVNGVLQLVGPPACGIIYENVLSYKPIFLAFGIILILGTALWAIVPIIKRNSKKDLESI